MESKLKVFNVEFKIYKDVLYRDVLIIAYSPKQARKFFFDWWRKNWRRSIIVTMIYEVDKKKTQLKLKSGTIEGKFKEQQDYIYRGKSDEDKR